MTRRVGNKQGRMEKSWRLREMEGLGRPPTIWPSSLEIGSTIGDEMQV